MLIKIKDGVTLACLRDILHDFDCAIVKISLMNDVFIEGATEEDLADAQLKILKSKRTLDEIEKLDIYPAILATEFFD